MNCEVNGRSKLRQVLDLHRIKRKDFAAELGVSQTCLYEYLAGRSWPRAENLRKILNLLKPYGVTIDDILPDSPHRQGKL